MSKQKETYAINKRALSMLYPFKEDLSLEKDKNYLFDLSFLSTLKVSGEKSAEFLQGQLSCDIRQVTEDSMRQAAMCNLKGRILAMLDVYNHQGLNMLLPCDLREHTRKSLDKAALFSKVSLEHESRFKIYGFYQQNPGDKQPCDIPSNCSKYQMIQSHGIHGYHLGDELYIFFAEQQKQAALGEKFNLSNKQWRSSLAWHKLRLSHAHVNIYPETLGVFLPHRLGLHQAGYLSFDKGCYKGQEIIARTHYKATLKHELKLFSIKTSEALFSGQKISDGTGEKEIGELVDYSPIDEELFIVALSLLIDRTNPVYFEGHKEAISLNDYQP